MAPSTAPILNSILDRTQCPSYTCEGCFHDPPRNGCNERLEGTACGACREKDWAYYCKHGAWPEGFFADDPGKELAKFGRKWDGAIQLMMTKTGLKKMETAWKIMKDSKFDVDKAVAMYNSLPNIPVVNRQGHGNNPQEEILGFRRTTLMKKVYSKGSRNSTVTRLRLHTWQHIPSHNISSNPALSTGSINIVNNISKKYASKNGVMGSKSTKAKEQTEESKPHSNMQSHFALGNSTPAPSASKAGFGPMINTSTPNMPETKKVPAKRKFEYYKEDPPLDSDSDDNEIGGCIPASLPGRAPFRVPKIDEVTGMQIGWTWKKGEWIAVDTNPPETNMQRLVNLCKAKGTWKPSKKPRRAVRAAANSLALRTTTSAANSLPPKIIDSATVAPTPRATTSSTRRNDSENSARLTRGAMLQSDEVVAAANATKEKGGTKCGIDEMDVEVTEDATGLPGGDMGHSDEARSMKIAANLERQVSKRRGQEVKAAKIFATDTPRRVTRSKKGLEDKGEVSSKSAE